MNIGSQSVTCKVKRPFRYRDIEYKEDDNFEVRHLIPAEKGYLNIGVVERYPLEDYTFQALRKVTISDTSFLDEEIPLEYVLKTDMDMYIRLGYVQQSLKGCEVAIENDTDIKTLPLGTIPAKGHKILGIKYAVFMNMLKKLDINNGLTAPMTDEQILKINEFLRSK